ncbi:MAG: hypothetical protein R2706_01405 [Acidimicrobiales bacterium]
MSEIKPLSPAWLDAIVAASADRPSAGGLHGVVTLTVPRQKLTIEIADGKVLGARDDEVDTVLPFTGQQYHDWLAGSLNLSAAYTTGDLRATGPTGPLLAALELLDDPLVRAAVG